MEYTEKQLRDWQSYERVRKSGRYNMFDPRAQKASKLGREDYLFVLKNYSELKEAQEKK